MTIIKRKTVEEYISSYPLAEAGLRGWFIVNQKSTFSNILELRKAYPSADNLKGSDYICINSKKDAKAVQHLLELTDRIEAGEP
ncbi:hypothetical protein EXM22_13705 [Oceanispirochaeta crateris]|uniref:Uncharacterized protein n=1 Tax=Oceanispirochaeta crateris TaxID=2518645 RepID=A0A5C1QLQ3_9SPIO|nr:type II toxin-antitoxin system HigB family toxin [Oceanispirochaeta crateris]QEN08993.1 hypothetical protein EXM22_13705 [Oceanispirochaeta crateris]